MSTQQAEQESAPAPQADHGHGHPGVRDYVRIAVVLFVVTAIEVALYYAELAGMFPDEVLTVSLIALSTIKFFLVIFWYMHLKFDSLMFRRMFYGGILLAFAIYIVVLLTFGIFLG